MRPPFLNLPCLPGSFPGLGCPHAPAPNRGPCACSLPRAGVASAQPLLRSHATPSCQMRKRDAERKLAVQSSSQWLCQEAGLLLLSLPRAQRKPQLGPQPVAVALCAGLPHSRWPRLCAQGCPRGAQPGFSAVPPPGASPGSGGAARGPLRSLLALPPSQVKGKARSLR